MSLAGPKADNDMYRRVFGQGEGEVILEDLVTRFTKPAQTQGGIDAILQTYKDAGARDVLELILKKVQQAREDIASHDDRNDNE